MSLNSGAGNRAEGNLVLGEGVSMKGVRGVLFYVDFSRVEANSGAGPVASVTLNGNDYRSNYGSKVGYYYQGGSWNQTSAVNACRMQLPVGFAGWVYVPLTSYTGAGALYDAETGIGLDVTVTNMNLYTDGYVYSATNSITFDEILFVK